MRVAFLLLVCVGAALAADPFEAALRDFEVARRSVFPFGSEVQILPAIDNLVEQQDARAVPHLLAFLLQTSDAEADLFERIGKAEATGAEAVGRLGAIDTEIGQLRRRAEAGATDIGPAIERLKAERTEQERTFQRIRHEVTRLGRAIGVTWKVRDKVLDGLGRTLAALEGDALRKSLVTATETLDAAHPVESLLLVRVLRQCKRPETVDPLIELVRRDKVHPPARRRAASALAAQRDPRGIAALLDLWAGDPEGMGEHVRHALSLAAGRRLADLESARLWAASLTR
jgi:hypothetical protein